MDRIPDWVPSVGALVPALVGLVGLIAAASQLTLAARLRRLETWARSAGESETGRRAESLKQIERVAVARLVATTYVPSYHFLYAIVVPLGVAQWVFTAVSDHESVRSQLWTVVTASVVSVMFVRQGIRVYLERERIGREYLHGLEVAPARLGILDRMEGGTRREFTLAVLLSVSIELMAWAAALLAATGPDRFWMVAVLVVAAVVPGQVFDELRRASVMAELRDNNAPIWEARRKLGRPSVGDPPSGD